MYINFSMMNLNTTVFENENKKENTKSVEEKDEDIKIRYIPINI